MLKLNLGAGRKPAGGDWVNVDVVPRGHGPEWVRADLDVHPWPFGDATVSEVYSSHAFEHLADPRLAIREVARICAEGATVTVVVPHPWQQMAMCPGHRCALAPRQFRHWCEEFADEAFAGLPRRLRLDRLEYLRDGEFFPRLRLLYHGWSDQDIIELLPGACHEVAVRMTVVAASGTGV